MQRTSVFPVSMPASPFTGSQLHSLITKTILDEIVSTHLTFFIRALT
jgi:hypothetical protein